MLFVRDRVKQGTTTTGAGTITLDSSFGGYQNFSVLDNGTQTFYAIEESTNWEVGIGTYSSNTLTRDTVLAGASGDGVPIYLSGSATAFITYPASGAVFTTGNIASLTGVKLGVSGVAFSDGTTQTTAGTSFSATSGARIDLNDGRISTIESTGVALTGSVSSLAGSGVGYSSRISTIESTGVALTGSVSSLAGSGVGYSSRISTIESTGVALTGSVSSLAGSGVGYSSRISTIESTGVALTGSVIALATSGTSNFTGIYNTSGNLDSRLIATGNALESSSFSAFTGAKIDLNTSRVTAIMSTGVALTGSVINLASSGVGYSSRISTIESTGVALTGSVTSLASSGVGYSSRISTIESSGLAIHTAGTGLTLVGNEFNTTGTGHFDQITFTNDVIRLGKNLSTTQREAIGTYPIAIGYNAGQNTTGTHSVMIGTNAGTDADDTSNLYSTFIGWNAGYELKDSRYSVIIGAQTATPASGLPESVIIGHMAGVGAYDQSYANMIGYHAGQASSGCDGTTMIGVSVGAYAKKSLYSNFIGANAGLNASGNYNLYLGYYAGRVASGTNNIEIVTQGPSVSTIGNNSNKISIEKTIIGDTNLKLLAIGDVGTGNLTPEATIEILPSDANDIGLKVQGAVSQAANLTEWHTGVLAVAKVDETGAISGQHFEFGDGTIQTTALVAGSFSSASGAKVDANTTNLITTGNFLTSEIIIVSGLAGGGTSAATGARIDLNSSRISTIESTGVALTGSVIALATSGTSNFTGIYNTSGNLDSRLIATGNALESSSFSAFTGAKIDLNTSRVTAIMSTGVALTGSVINLASSGVGYSSRISTIESTGVALTGSVIDLATSGTSNFTGIYNTSGNLDSRLIATGNALESSSFSAFTGAKIDLNTSRVTAIMSTGVALTGSVINLASSGRWI